MFTAGSKLYVGLAGLTVASLVVYGATQNFGALGAFGLIFLLLCLAGLGAVTIWSRDSTVSAMDTAAVQQSAAAAAPVGDSMWPLVAAAGGVLLAVGVVTDKRYFVAGLGAILIAALEWAIRAWSDRASADPAYNTLTRRRLAHPLELPVAGTVALTVLIFGFSRLMLTADKKVGPVLFGVMAAVILLIGTWFAFRRATSMTIMAGVLGVATVAILGLGIAAAAKGERTELTEAQQLDHFNSRTSTPDCTSTVTEADEHTPGAVAAKSNILADMVFDGSALAANQIGAFENGGVLTIDKGATVWLMFHNDSEEEARLRVFAGSVTTSSNGTDITTETEYCTRMVEPGKVANLTVTMPRSSYGLADGEGYFAEVPGHDGTKVEIVVP